MRNGPENNKNIPENIFGSLNEAILELQKKINLDPIDISKTIGILTAEEQIRYKDTIRNISSEGDSKIQKAQLLALLLKVKENREIDEAFDNSAACVDSIITYNL